MLLKLKIVLEKYVILVSAGMELVFFVVAATVLCFGFRIRMMLVTH